MNDYMIIILVFVLLIFLLTGRKKKAYRAKPQYRRKSLRRDNLYLRDGRLSWEKEKSAEEKGAEGEWFVATAELGRLPGDLFFVFNDIIVPASDGTSQIDHVVVADQGIFVIETKNYQGTVYGNEKSSDWYQFIGNNQYPFHNPLHQNYGHVKTLSQALQMPETYFISIVVFPNQTKLNIEARDTVLHTYELADNIRNYTAKSPLTEKQRDLACARLKELMVHDSVKKQEHVNNVKKKILERDEKIKAGICPRCGGKLTLRAGKYGQFYGCSNYPKCGFTMQKS